jgi:phospholipid transport system substrate-binding protein
MRKFFPMKVLIAAMLTMVAASNVWAGSEDPKDVVQNTVNGIIKVLEARADVTILTEMDRENIRKVVKGRFDYREMAQRSLAQTWQDISEEEKVNFTELFRKLLERSYGNRLASFRNQTVSYDDAQYKGDKARVQTSVIDADKTTPVEYRLHQTPTGWQVYDIKIEGVSLVSNFRNDFQEGLMRDGGFAGLVKELEEKVAKLEAGDDA